MDPTVALGQLCERLRREPLLHMSLGSKELFHTNLLAYYADRYHDVADEVFGPWCTPAPTATTRDVHRERGNLDLVLELPRLTPLIIENKVFSIPDERQLEIYAAGPARNFSHEASLLA